MKKKSKFRAWFKRRKKAALLLLALLLTLAANCYPSCRVYINGERLDGLYSPRFAAAGELTAEMAAEEITPLSAELPRVSRRYCLSLASPSADVRTLTDSILRETPGVASATKISAEGETLGFVESGAILSERLHEALYAGLSQGMEAGLQSPLGYERLYTRAELVRSYEEMIALIKATVPVVYTA